MAGSICERIIFSLILARLRRRGPWCWSPSRRKKGVRRLASLEYGSHHTSGAGSDVHGSLPPTKALGRLIIGAHEQSSFDNLGTKQVTVSRGLKLDITDRESLHGCWTDTYFQNGAGWLRGSQPQDPVVRPRRERFHSRDTVEQLVSCSPLGAAAATGSTHRLKYEHQVGDDWHLVSRPHYSALPTNNCVGENSARFHQPIATTSYLYSE